MHKSLKYPVALNSSRAQKALPLAHIPCMKMVEWLSCVAEPALLRRNYWPMDTVAAQAIHFDCSG